MHPVASLAELAREFDLEKLSQGSARFDEAELNALSARTLHATPFANVKERLAALGISGRRRRGVLDGGSRKPGQAERQRGMVGCRAGEIVNPAREDAEYLAAALAELPPEPWDGQTWGDWTGRLKERTGRKGRALFHPLRLALTGREAGPELAALLPLIGRSRASSRLRAPSA